MITDLIPNILVVIPVFNEAENIESVILDIRRVDPAVAICVVNDASTDQTRTVLDRMDDSNLTVLHHCINQGYGVSIQTGYKYALAKEYDYVLQLDGDGQHDPMDLGRFVQAMRDNPVDAVIGSRFLTDGQVPLGLMKKSAILFYRCLIKMITKEFITDPTSGYQMLNRSIMAYYAGDHFPTDYPDANLICWALNAGYRFKELPVEMKNRTRGESMHGSVVKNIYYMYKVTFTLLLSIFSKRKRKN